MTRASNLPLAYRDAAWAMLSRSKRTVEIVGVSAALLVEIWTGDAFCGAYRWELENPTPLAADLLRLEPGR